MKLRLLLLGPISLIAALALAEPSSEPVTIWVDGVRLAGDLWKPGDLTAAEKRPALLMVHGWGGTKDHLNRAYAPRFASLGYIVLTFDYRGWGESDGKLVRIGDKPTDSSGEFALLVKEVRTIVDPLDQLEDIRAAHAYLVGEPQVDGDRLAIWGSSLGGGLALASAATLPGFKVLMTQVGSVNPRANAGAANDPLSPANMLRLRSRVSRGELPPFPGPESGVQGLTGFPDWHRFVRYDPFATAAQLNAATLIIEVADEDLMDISMNGAALFAAIKERLTARYEVLPGKHFDIYSGESFAAAVEMQQAWLMEHLPVSVPVH